MARWNSNAVCACASCDSADASARRLTLPLRHQLLAIQPRDHLPLLHGVAFVHGALDQPARRLERDVTSFSSMFPEMTMRLSGGFLPIRNAYTAAAAATARIRIMDQQFASLSSLHHAPRTAPIACARSILPTL